MEWCRRRRHHHRRVAKRFRSGSRMVAAGNLPGISVRSAFDQDMVTLVTYKHALAKGAGPGPHVCLSTDAINLGGEDTLFAAVWFRLSQIGGWAIPKVSPLYSPHGLLSWG